MEEITLEEYRALQKKGVKYHNHKCEVDGIAFDSKAEALRYAELKLLEASGEITDLTLQPVFELQPAFIRADGERIDAIRYVGDFAYMEGYTRVVEDTKGVVTAVFAIKRKMLLLRYPDIDFRVLDRNGHNLYERKRAA